MTQGLINQKLKMINKRLVHTGLDISVSPRSSKKRPDQLEMSDFVIIKGDGSILPHAEFDSNKVAALYDQVIVKLFESDIAPVVESQDNGPLVKAINGKVIKKIIENKDGNHEIELQPGITLTSDIKSYINGMISVCSAASIHYSEKVLHCKNQLRMGTLDMPKNSKTLVVHTANGPEEVKRSVKNKELLASLWFITDAFYYSPTFRKHLAVTVTEGKYTCGYKDGEAFFDQSNLSDLEKQIAQDLKII